MKDYIEEIVPEEVISIIEPQSKFIRVPQNVFHSIEIPLPKQITFSSTTLDKILENDLLGDYVNSGFHGTVFHKEGTSFCTKLFTSCYDLRKSLNDSGIKTYDGKDKKAWLLAEAQEKIKLQIAGHKLAGKLPDYREKISQIYMPVFNNFSRNRLLAGYICEYTEGEVENIYNIPEATKDFYTLGWLGFYCGDPLQSKGDGNIVLQSNGKYKFIDVELREPQGNTRLVVVEENELYEP
jgi:hypothetical protein